MDIKKIESVDLHEKVCGILEDDMREKVGFTMENDRKKIAFALYEGDKICGGVIGTLVCEGFHTNQLAVEKEFRGRNYGKELMIKVEAAAAEAGAKVLTVSTQDYQALPFYEKLGYKVFGELEDWPFKGTTKYYLTKKV